METRFERIFNEEVINGKTVFVFDRQNEVNLDDINASASLAMHKALIGICELSLLEEAEKQLSINMRLSKTIQSYYILYHIFTGCMVLDSDYKLIYNQAYHYGTNIHNLRNIPNTPEKWNERGMREKDLAVNLKHMQIKEYCEEFRKKTLEARKEMPMFLRKLYEYFIDEDSCLILFEKADYLRDKAIYRPSAVAQRNQNRIQTSMHFHEWTHDFPSSDALYEAVANILNVIFKDEDNYFSFCEWFNINSIDCQTEYARSLGYEWSDLEQIGGFEKNKSVPCFVGQLMELYPFDQTRMLYNKYWKPLLKYK